MPIDVHDRHDGVTLCLYRMFRCRRYANAGLCSAMVNKSLCIAQTYPGDTGSINFDCQVPLCIRPSKGQHAFLFSYSSTLCVEAVKLVVENTQQVL